MNHRILIVDDSSYARRALRNMTEEILGTCEFHYAGTGDEGLALAFRIEPNLIFLDLEMPRMDGFTFLRLLMARRPTPVIIVSSRDDRQSILKALELGALDFVAKPTRQTSTRIYELVDLLRDKLKAIEAARFPTPARRPSAVERAADTLLPETKQIPFVHSEPRRLIAIGASTGGPGTLNNILGSLKLQEDVALVIVQHMPPGFTEAFAQRLDRVLSFPVREIRNLDRIDAGSAYVCPGGFNCEVSRGRDLRFRLRDPDETTRFVPSIDVFFRSVAKVFGAAAAGVVLTGMGNDGAEGGREMAAAGARLIAEDPATALVNGMPAALVASGAATHVYHADTIAGALGQWQLGLLSRDG